MGVILTIYNMGTSPNTTTPGVKLGSMGRICFFEWMSFFLWGWFCSCCSKGIPHYSVQHEYRKLLIFNKKWYFTCFSKSIISHISYICIIHYSSKDVFSVPFKPFSPQVVEWMWSKWEANFISLIYPRHPNASWENSWTPNTYHPNTEPQEVWLDA